MCVLRYVVFCCFKQKTAYEMRISDWSSDVCSSDLGDLDAYLRYSSGQPRAAGVQPDRIEEVKVIGMRRRIAENMAESKRNIPHFTYVEEVDVTEQIGRAHV